MFELGWDEMALIAVVALVFIGPKDLPVVLRQIGRWTRRAKDMAAEFQRGVDEMVREAEIKEMKERVEKLAQTDQMKRHLENTIDPTGAISDALSPPVMEPVKLAPPETAPEVPPPPSPIPADWEDPYKPYPDEAEAQAPQPAPEQAKAEPQPKPDRPEPKQSKQSKPEQVIELPETAPFTAPPRPPEP